MATAASRPLVLVVEDDTRLAPALAMMIEDWGYECVVVYTSGAAAAALGARVGDVAVVVADLSDGEHWGSDRTFAAVSTAVGPHVAVIATSTHPGQARRNGFTTVLAKPYDPDELRALLQRAVAQPAATRRAC